MTPQSARLGEVFFSPAAGVGLCNPPASGFPASGCDGRGAGKGTEAMSN